MLKEVLAIIDGSAGSMTAIDTAVEFVQHHQAHLQLSVLFESVSLLAAAEPSAYGYSLQANDEYCKEDLTAIREKLAGTSVGADIHAVCLDPVQLVRAAKAQARYADLALIGPPETWGSARLRRHVAEGLVIDAGTPALLYQKGWMPALFRRAVLGWNGSAEAARAARSLIALLEPGATIDVLSVEEKTLPEGSAADFCKNIGHFLARHGFEVKLHLRQSDGEAATSILQAFARHRQADLLAVGAYAHSPLRERLLGGVTNDLIDDPRVPVLLVR